MAKSRDPVMSVRCHFGFLDSRIFFDFSLEDVANATMR